VRQFLIFFIKFLDQLNSFQQQEPSSYPKLLNDLIQALYVLLRAFQDFVINPFPLISIRHQLDLYIFQK
jgi:hypothetical protein